jgi:DnaJ-domain-containing protein 1
MAHLIRREHFYLFQIALGAGFLILLAWLRTPKQPESRFRVREADRKSSQPAQDGGLADAKMKRAEPLRLGGIRIDAPPHEILGIRPGASAAQIQKAWRELMKRYHPDRIGRPGTREWQDAQKIAEAINHAKDELLKSAR